MVISCIRMMKAHVPLQKMGGKKFVFPRDTSIMHLWARSYNLKERCTQEMCQSCRLLHVERNAFLIRKDQVWKTLPFCTFGTEQA